MKNKTSCILPFSFIVCAHPKHAGKIGLLHYSSASCKVSMHAAASRNAGGRSCTSVTCTLSRGIQLMAFIGLIMYLIAGSGETTSVVTSLKTFKTQNSEADKPVQKRRPPLRYPSVPLTLLSTDMHISLIADIKDLVVRHFANITIHDESLSGHCHYVGTCSSKMPVLSGVDRGQIMYVHNSLKRTMFEHYREGSPSNDSFVRDADVIHCSHPTGMCELYMPFNKSVILWATTRFEQGREADAHRFQGFVKNFRAMASKPGNAVMANSVYDQMYVYYFTGIMPAYMPSFCAYPGVKYSWDGVRDGDDQAFTRTIIGAGYRPKFGSPGTMQELIAQALRIIAARGSKMTVAHLRAVYQHYSYADLARHPAILYFPYQVSVMSFFEQYRMGIPLIAPGVKLLTQWQLSYGMLSERTWTMVFQGHAPSGSIIEKYPGVDIPYDPNDEKTPAAVEYWLRFSDFYTFPHVLTFETMDELADIILHTDFKEVSRKMMEENARLEKELVNQWRGIWENVIPQRARPSLAAIHSYDEAMDAIYGAGNWTDY